MRNSNLLKLLRFSNLLKKLFVGNKESFHLKAMNGKKTFKTHYLLNERSQNGNQFSLKSIEICNVKK